MLFELKAGKVITFLDMFVLACEVQYCFGRLGGMEESISIDEFTYLTLHGNLFTKLRAFFNTPNSDPSFLL
jgi:hypothetical protein